MNSLHKMARGSPLSSDLRNSIIHAHKNGNSTHKIGRDFNLPRTTVQGIINNNKKRGNNDIGIKSGRPRIANDFDRRTLRRLIKQKRFSTASSLNDRWRASIKKGVPKSTCIREVKKLGYKFSTVIFEWMKVCQCHCTALSFRYVLFQPRAKPLLTKIQMKKRLEWAKEHQNWVQRQWDSVIWSDESKFEVHFDNPQGLVIRTAAEANNSDCLRRKVKYPGSIMVWGCMSSQGVGVLHIIDGTVNAAVYGSILTWHLLPSIETLQTADGEFIFQQDNAPCHKARSITSWFTANEIQVLPWPANSPDLSPIENLWGKMKKSLRESPIFTIAALKERVVQVWSQILPEECQKLVSTMPRRIKEVIHRKGDATKW